MDSPNILSKTSFLKFEQCPKAFFFYKQHPYLRDKLTSERQITFRRGHDVGYFARQLFSGGIDVCDESSGAEEALACTARLIRSEVPVIYEATFAHNGVLVMVDILCLKDGKYTAYEVKSSLRVTETYLRDACLQHYVLSHALQGFDDLFLVTMNPEYELEDAPDPKKLFRRRSVAREAIKNAGYFDFQVSAARIVLEENRIPNIPIGTQCFRPYQCDYFGTCWKETIHDQSIFNMPFFGKDELLSWHHSGIREIGQVPDALIKKESLARIKRAFVDNAPIIDAAGIRAVLQKIRQPCAAMDMEIWSPAIPRLRGTRPFEQIPFLVSFFDGKGYMDYFADNETDDRETFATRLIALAAPYATVLVYDKSMEVNVIASLARKFPHLAADLTALREKLVDIFEVFLKVHFYHPSFKNNFSLKGVTKCLLPELNYSGIGSGLEAMHVYDSYRESRNDIERSLLRNDLVNYCNTDVLATFRLTEFLQDIMHKKTPAG